MKKWTVAAAFVAAMAMPVGMAQAQGWKPTQDVELVIPFGVGGGSDLMGRIIGKVIVEEKLLDVPLVINNRPGGGGAVGIGYVSASRRADPHTIILVNGTTQITPILTPAAKTLSEVKGVANFMLDDFLIFVKGDSKYKTLEDLVEDVKARPNKNVNFGTGGTTDVMAITIFSNAIGKEVNPVNFNSGGEAMTALLGAHVDGVIGNPIEFMGHLQSGAVRALGVFRDERFEALPDVPTLKERGINAPNFQMWRGLALPKGVSEDVQAFWQDVARKVAASDTMKNYIAENVASEALIVGDEFDAFLVNQEKLYRELLGKPAE